MLNIHPMRRNNTRPHQLRWGDLHACTCVYTHKQSHSLTPSPLSLHKAPIVVLGNKRDLNAIREVDTGKATQWARTHAVKFYEVTVLEREGLRDPICYIAWRMANPGGCGLHMYIFYIRGRFYSISSCNALSI